MVNEKEDCVYWMPPREIKAECGDMGGFREWPGHCSRGLPYPYDGECFKCKMGVNKWETSFLESLASIQG